MPVGAGGDGWRRCTKRKGDKGQTGEELTSRLLAKGSETRRVKTPGKEMAAVVTVADARRGRRTCSGLGRFGSLFRTSEEKNTTMTLLAWRRCVWRLDQAGDELQLLRFMAEANSNRNRWSEQRRKLDEQEVGLTSDLTRKTILCS
jgi:hypothetical protein